MLNVTHIVPYFVPAWAYGGIPRLAFELAREQARMGHRVNVITTDVFDEKSRHPEAGCTISMEGGALKARYLRNVSNRHAYDHQMFMPIGMKKALDEMAVDADIIHIHGHRHILEVKAEKFARDLGIPYVVTANGTAPRIERKRGIKFLVDVVSMDKILRRAAAVIAVSRAEVEQYLDRGVSKDKIHIIPNGLDADSFKNLPAKGTFRKEWVLDEAPIILYVGKITPRKGLIHLARAAARIIEKRKINFVIAGNDMGFLAEVKKEAGNLGIAARTTYTGLVRGNMKRAAYIDASVTVYPSEFEIFGLVPFESILCGTPVVVSDDSGCGEIIGEAKIGIVTPYGNAALLAEAIESAIDSPQESRQQIEIGKKFIRENFAWPKIAAQTIELYSSVLSRRNKRGAA